MKYLIISTILSTLLQQTAANAAAAVLAPAGGPDTPIDVVPKNYTDAEGILLQGFLSLPNHNDGDAEVVSGGSSDEKKKLPAVIVIHDQSGPDTYEQQRATILARDFGYVGFAADIYGVNTVQPPADAPFSERQPFISQFTGNATLFAMRIQAAVDYIQGMEEVDETKVAIVGYCLGGTGVVHYLNTHDSTSVDGGVPLAGAISIHPSLLDWPGPTVDIKIPALFLTGGSDFLTSPQTMAKLETDMKIGTSTGATDAESYKSPWETVRYAKIEHAFSNWLSGGYDERADARSWHSMTTFLEEEFGLSDDESMSPPPGPEELVISVNYADNMDGDYPLMGYVSMPESTSEDTLLPAVIILPHKMDSVTGPNRYEQQRATELANEAGYIGFVADIYSQDLKESTASELEEMYHANFTKYLSRIHAAVDHVKNMDDVDPDKIAVIGFGFGGSGALYYALSEDGVDSGVKAIASFHGELEDVAKVAEAKIVPKDAASTGDGNGFQWTAAEDDNNNSSLSWDNADNDGGPTRRRMNTVNTPQILIQSGVEEDDMDDVIQIEKALIDMEADYELTRFSDTQESFTLWNDEQGRYNPRATARSMDQLSTVLFEVGFTSVNTNDGTKVTESPAAAPHDDHGEGGHVHDSTAKPTSASSASLSATTIGFVFATTWAMVVLLL
mmetsp:Transcript_28532/g.60802  ORF Transcript_28532/g.60802 Transcript_28532/m.60802 type:complete len:673 (+) Transcript_28532:59-2077(+)